MQPLADILNTLTRAAEAAGGSRRRPFAPLLRYAVLGAVALSILPATAAGLPRPAPEKSNARGNAGSKPSPEQRRRGGRADGAAHETNVRLPPKINARRFKDLLLKGKELYDRGKLDLGRTFKLTVEADLNKDGTLSSIAVMGAADDPAFKELTRDAVVALSENRVFSFIEGTPRLRLGLLLDREKLTATLAAELGTARRAEETARVYHLGITAMRFKKAGTAEEPVWKNMTASASGKQLALKLEMTRAEAGNLLLKQITPN